MSEAKSFRRTRIGGRTLHPATQMMSYGYDPSMSEGAVKPPVFLTSTFAFQSAKKGPISLTWPRAASRRRRTVAPAVWCTAVSTIPIRKSSRTGWRCSMARKAPW